jgi:hypothetical protein
MRNEVARAFQRAKTPITERTSKQVRHPNITTNPPTPRFSSAHTPPNTNECCTQNLQLMTGHWASTHRNY